MRNFIILIQLSLFLIVSSDKNKKANKFLKNFLFHKNHHLLRKLENSDKNLIIGFDKYSHNKEQKIIEFFTKIKFPHADNITSNISIPLNISFYNPKEVVSKNVECGERGRHDSYCTYFCMTDIQNNNISTVKLNDKDNQYFLTSLADATKVISSQKSNNFLNINNITILDHAEIFRKSERHFVIKGELLDSDYESNNIKLIEAINSYGKKLSCKGYEDRVNLMTYYFLDCDISDSPINIDLQNSFAYLEDSKDKGIIINFDNSDNSTMTVSGLAPKKKSSGLSTGGIIAIVIPCILLLILAGGLIFYLNRKAPNPPLKELANNSNTIGPAGASSSNVVNQ